MSWADWFRWWWWPSGARRGADPIDSHEGIHAVAAYWHFLLAVWPVLLAVLHV